AIAHDLAVLAIDVEDAVAELVDQSGSVVDAQPEQVRWIETESCRRGGKRGKHGLPELGIVGDVSFTPAAPGSLERDAHPSGFGALGERTVDLDVPGEVFRHRVRRMRVTHTRQPIE